MQIIKSVAEMQQWSSEQVRSGRRIGLVPTMGYLHEGHLSLVREARKQCDLVVVSIFVNPIQFGAGEDFEEYPRDLTRDCALLEKEQVDVVFAPGVKDMYPEGYSTFVEVQGEVAQKMCGASRPGHFRGVTTVCSKLFHICQPTLAFFGQKDAQQAIILEKMVRELNFPLQIVRMPIVREADGLAMSSRNVYLNPQQRQEALVLSQSLRAAEQLIKDGERDPEKVRAFIKDIIETKPGAQIDYIEINRASDLASLDRIEGTVLIALAVKFGTTRLIDNLMVEV
ncbi:MAG TPA: pantoate--beta-alanine ligase [Syntrophomonadaceae bacterium]|nr:pantoate--beta-alanine ligase [Syntrophomonadaceae bacterium]HOQ10187.1 pantoate--beta-alanine ligase [Syntrophomonadaceae bacterium]HPU49776.1 pantoate--beta-alanine ligase [Syntrophomonadaceae bacterium]